MAPMHKLHFIAVSNDTNRDVAFRKTIRARAAHAARSLNASEHTKRQYKQSLATSTASQRGGMNRFQSQPMPASTKKSLATKDHSSPLHDRLSVWDPIVSPIGCQAWNLLHYYRHFFRARSWALSFKRDWFAFIIEDPVATHATLSFVALNRDLEEGTTISPWTLSHRQRALQLVRHELARQRDLPKDAFIGAVALLAVTEGLDGHTSSASAHAKALSKLVRLRGGFATLQNNEALSRLVAWADFCHVSTFSSGPRTASFLDQTDVMLKSPSFEVQGDLQFTFIRTMKSAMPSDIFQMLVMLGSVPKHPPTDDTTSHKRENISQLIHNINQRLLTIHFEKPAFESGPVGELAKTLCYAAHLYISLVLRQMPRRTKVVVERAARLHKALHELDCVKVWDKPLIEPYLVVSLWAHTLFFCSLVPAAQANLQNCELKSLLSALSISNLEQFSRQLCKISWMELSFDDELRRILGLLQRLT